MMRASYTDPLALAVSNELGAKQRVPRMMRSASLETLPDVLNPVFEKKKALLPDMPKPDRYPPFVLNNPEDLVA
eukprot:10061581-Karenia_brevis.AAC.1